MARKKITAILIDPETDTARVEEIPDNLGSFYELLRCDCIDIVTRKIGNTYYDIICDDEGLLKDTPYISAINKACEPMLVGALLVCGRADEKGSLTSLTASDIKNISEHVLRISTKKHPEPYMALAEIEY